MITVYISGPYTRGDTALNVKAAIEAGDYVESCLGHAAFIPHFTHFQHMLRPHPWEFWMRQDIEWLTRCDWLLRLPGESQGADLEEAIALRKGMPVFHSVAEIPMSQEEPTPRKGAIAFCSLGRPGLIKTDSAQEIQYHDGNKGVAWLGWQLTDGKVTGVGLDKGAVIEQKVGDGWSSRTPVVVGYFPEFLEQLDK